MYNNTQTIVITKSKVSRMKKNYCWINRSAIWEHGKLLGSDGVAILMVISCCLNDRTMRSFPSQGYIARTLGIAKITVNRYLKLLESVGYIERDLKNGVKTFYKLTQPVVNIEVNSGFVLQGNEVGVISREPLPLSPENRINQNITNRINTLTQHPTKTEANASLNVAFPKPPINKTKKSVNHYSEGFEAWWKLYPARNGIKAGKPDAYKKFLKIEDIPSLITATKAYAASKEVKEGFAKDAVRFLKDGVWDAWRGQRIDSKPIVDAFDRYRNMKPEDLA